MAKTKKLTKDLAEKISKIVDYQGEIVWDRKKPDGTPRKKLDCTKINNLGWFSKTDLNTGINISLEYFKNQKIKNLFLNK